MGRFGGTPRWDAAMGRFGEFLIGEGKLRPEQLRKAMECQGLVGGRLGSNLLELGLMPEQTLLEALGKFRHSRTASAHQLRNVAADTLGLVPPKIAQRHHIVPVEHRGHTLVLASKDPGDPLLEDELGHLTSCLVRTVIGLELRIHEALTRYYGVPQTPRLTGLARRLDGVAAPRDEAWEPPPETEPEGRAPPSPQPPRPTPPRRASRPPTAPAPDAPSPAIQYIELDDDTKARIYTESAALRNPGARLAAASEELQKTSIRDEIGDVLLDFCRPYLRRRLLLVRRKDHVVGWRGEGDGVDGARVRALEIPAEEPSVFLTLLQGTKFWLGALAPLPAHQRLVESLGDPPKDCLVLPIELRSRVVCFLYGDNARQGVGSAPLSELKRLVRKAGVAFEVCILKHKLRTL